MKKVKNEMALLEHLEELRKRLLISAIGLLVTTVVCFFYVTPLRELLTRPAGDMQLIYLTPPEALMANIRIAFIGGVVLAMPVIFSQIILFISPGLYKNEKKFIYPTVLAMMFLFALGLTFAYYTVLPFAIRFFLTFETETLAPMFTISNYLSFATNFLFAFGFVFQLPLVFLFLGKLNLVSAPFLRKSRKYALLVIVILSAVITPPDVFSQILMSIPLILLFEIGILLVALVQRGKKKEAKAEVIEVVEAEEKEIEVVEEAEAPEDENENRDS